MVEYLEPNPYEQYDKKVVILGGGTGIISILRGLKILNNPAKLVAGYTTWDDGGSTGNLRNEFGILPKGDARRQFLALIPNERKMHLVQELFEQRPTYGGERHNFGNLFLLELDRIHDNKGLEAACEMFDVKSKILGASLNPLTLCFKDQRGKEYYGEHHLDDRAEQSDFDPQNRISSIYFAQVPKANPLLIDEIMDADYVVHPSGSQYGSVLPFNLIREIREAINETKAKVIRFQNVMTEPGQTDGYTTVDELNEYNRYMRNPNRLDYLIVHENHIPKNVLDIYAREGQVPVAIDEEMIKKCKELSPRLQIVRGQFATYFEDQHLIRHDPVKAARVILDTQSYLR